MNELIPIGQLEGIAASGEAFPVDFDHAWEWAGYPRKDSALRRLKRKFKENTDYILLHHMAEQDRQEHGENLKLHHMVEFQDESNKGAASKHAGGRGKQDKYFLSIDCFLKFCLLAKTEQGEKIFSALIARLKTTGIQQIPQGGGLTEAQLSKIVMEQNRPLLERLERLESTILTSPDIQMRGLKNHLFDKIVVTENPKDYVEFNKLYHGHESYVSEPIPQDAFASVVCYLCPQIKAKRRYGGLEFIGCRLKTSHDNEKDENAF